VPGAVSGIDTLLRRSLRATAQGGNRLILPRSFQGFPDLAHGGAVLAALDLTASPWVDRSIPRLIAARIQRSVPLETPLSLAAVPSGLDVALTLEHEGRLLVNGTISPAPPALHPAWNGQGGVTGASGFDLPTSRGCLACGVENTSGLQVVLRCNEQWVWSEYQPREGFRTDDGCLAAALFTVLLDETAWWLGALTSGEAGMTTEIRVTLERPDHPFGEPLVALGRRDLVTRVDRKGHFWKTETGVFTAGGARLASAEIIFAASRVYSRSLIPTLLLTNSPESVRRIFPGYVP
jgi:hypothetical protein